MLVLTRKKNESIRIGENIEIRIICVVDNHVRVGITAPRSIPVHREEIYQIIHDKELLNANDDASALELCANRSG